MPAGRPRIYQSPDEFCERVEQYFNDPETIAPNMAGLSLYMGFADKTSLMDYEGRGPEYSHAVKSARHRIENWLVNRLHREDSSKSAVGFVFHLKQFGWRDDQRQILSSDPNNPVQIQVIERVVVKAQDSDG